jgi:serine/threonine-protein kinase 11
MEGHGSLLGGALVKSGGLLRKKNNPRKRILDYQIVMKLGTGASGKVYLAFHPPDSQYYAIKKFDINELQHIPGGTAQLRRELAALRRLSHPNILRLFKILRAPNNSVVYTVLEYSQCGSLADRPELPPALIPRLFKQILNGLAYLRSLQLVHQDIKPSNLLLAADGRALISDFGVGHNFQSVDAVVGSPAYQAPELAEDCHYCEPTKEDIWSLGISLFEVLFGRLPWDGDTVYEIMANIRERPLVIPDPCDPNIKDLLAKGMLVKDPARRFAVRQCLDHPYFRAVDDTPVDLSILRRQLPAIDKSKEVVDIKVIECGDSLDFIPQGRTFEDMMRDSLDVQ